jgi:hypothetical protein
MSAINFVPEGELFFPEVRNFISKTLVIVFKKLVVGVQHVLRT